MISAIIQARIGSTRLPAKVLLKLGEKIVLERVIERALRAATVQDVVVATTVNKKDLKIVNWAGKKGFSVYCGSENDVLDRFYQAARLFGVKHIVRVTSDCPVIDPKIIDRVVRTHLKEKADLTANVLKETFPDGLDVEVFTFAALEKAWKQARLVSEREHVTPYIKKNPRLFKLVNLECKENLYHKRWTLDNKEDYEFLKQLYRRLYKKNPFFGMDEILKLLKKHPELEKINSHIGRNEGYQKSLREDRIAV